MTSYLLRNAHNWQQFEKQKLDFAPDGILISSAWINLVAVKQESETEKLKEMKSTSRQEQSNINENKEKIQLEDLFTNPAVKRIHLTGPAGIGKTVTVKHLCERWSHGKKNPSNKVIHPNTNYLNI